jgi:hypothetical protein
MTMHAFIRLAVATLVGVAAALLVSCGGSGKGLIPAAKATPLQGDFEAVARAAESGDGSCTDTQAALAKTEQDFVSLPSTVDRGLRARLQEGISHLRSRALAMCAQPNPTITTTTAPTTTPTTTTTPTQTTPTTTTTTTPTTTQTSPPPSSESGGAAAPGEAGGEEGKGKGKDKAEGEAEGSGGGASAGGTSAGGGR